MKAQAKKAPLRLLAARDLLDSVVEITQEQDCEHIRRSLAGTIGAMMAVNQVVFARPTRTADGFAVHELYRGPRGGDKPDTAPTLGALEERQMRDLLTAGHQLIPEDGTVTLLLPVMQRDALVELLMLRACEVSPHSLKLLKGFTRLYGNFRSLIVESEHDPLTGLLNRRTLEARLGGVVADAHRRSAALRWPGSQRRAGETCDYLAVVDIDHFKRINDTLGHLFGDEVLVLLARLMRQSFREEDVLFRFGGEEFVVILLAHTQDDAKLALERFREVVAGHRFPQIERVTVSIGLTGIRSGDVPAVAMGRADQAMYYAKSSGRNQVHEHERLAAAGLLPQQQAPQEVELF